MCVYVGVWVARARGWGVGWGGARPTNVEYRFHI